MKKITTLFITLLIATYSFGQYDIDDTSTFTFEDISTTGTQISLADDGEANITAPWTLYLGQYASTDLRIGNNGAILFGTTTGNVNASNTALTTTTPMIAPFWDDFDTELGGVYYKTITEYFNGIPLSSKFVIQWDRVHYNGSSNTDITSFQVVFYKSNISSSEEANRTIYFVYDDVDMDGTAWDNGLSATIGIATADEVSQYSYNTASLTGVNAIQFSVPTTNVPDDNFENYLETHNFEGYTRSIGDDDTMGDGIANNNKVFTNRINTVTDLDISGLNITDLTGIEDFTALQDFDCGDNQLTGTLDLTANPNLSHLKCDHNDFHGLITASNDNLITLDCSNNIYFSTLSLLGKYYLRTLNISNTDISQIDDVDGYSSRDLNFEDNVMLEELSAINISDDATIIDVHRQLNLVSLNVSYNDRIDKVILPDTSSSLKYFTMENTDGGNSYRAEIMNIPASTMLESFIISGTDAHDNSIIGGDTDIEYGLLDFSNCPNLQLLWISKTNVEKIDLRGVTANIVSGGFDIRNNRTLHCVYVDNVATAQSNWDNKKDYGTSFVADETACENRLVYVPDDNFENYLETHKVDGTVVSIGHAYAMGNGIANDNYVFANRIENKGTYTYYDNNPLVLDNLDIQDLTGIEGFTALSELTIKNDDSIESISLNANLWLQNLTVDNNSNLTSLDIQLERLELLRIENNNSLTSLVLIQNPKLATLYCNSNALSTLDLTQNSNLYHLECNNNALSTLDLTQNSNLYRLECNNNVLSTLDLTQNAELEYLYCNNNALSTLDLTHNAELRELYCTNNALSTLDLTQNSHLYRLECNNNALSTLDLTQNINLEYLYCNNNALSTLDLTQNSELDYLYCNNNQITSLNLDATKLYKLDARFNALTELHIQNGENDRLSGTYELDGVNYSRFRAQGNPNLTCIYVDNATDANNGVNDYESWQKDATASYVETEAQCNALDNNIVLQAKVLLQGPMLNPATAGLMNDNLRSLDYLPTTSPYGDAITVNASIFNTTGNNAIVDYVWVELRDTTDNIVASRSALLNRSGNIVDMGLNFGLNFNVPSGDYYIVIKHRNHLGVMSANPIALSSTATLVDFTDSAFSTYGNNAQVQLDNGKMAMWTGDSTNENKVKFSGSGNGANIIKSTVLNDPTNGWNSPTFTSTGYLNSDLDLDGGAKFSGSGNDSNIIKGNVLNHPSNNWNSVTYTINATVPSATLLNRTINNTQNTNIYLPPSDEVRRANELDRINHINQN